MIECCGHGAIHSSQSLLRIMRSFSILAHFKGGCWEWSWPSRGQIQVVLLFLLAEIFYLLRVFVMPA